MTTVQEYSKICRNLAEGHWEELPFQSFGSIWFQRIQETRILDGRSVSFAIGLRVLPNSLRFVARVFSTDLGVSAMQDIAKLDGGDYVPDLSDRANAAFEDLYYEVCQQWEQRKAQWESEYQAAVTRRSMMQDGDG